MRDVKQFETLVAITQTAAAPGDYEEILKVRSGSRMLVTLLIISGDPGATVDLDISHAFEVDNGEMSIGSMSLPGSTPGRRSLVFSDFHNIIKLKATVAGGTVAFKVGVSFYDNASTTRIENADLQVDVSAYPNSEGRYSSVRISDGRYEEVVNEDGSTNVRVVEDDDDDLIINHYEEVADVADGILTEIATFTIPGDKKARIVRVEASGESIAEYTVTVNGDTVALRRTYYDAGLNTEFRFDAPKDTGLKLAPGDVIALQVTHYRPGQLSKFEGRIQLVQESM